MCLEIFETIHIIDQVDIPVLMLHLVHCGIINLSPRSQTGKYISPLLHQHP